MSRIRTALVLSKNATLPIIQRYLPGNYSAVQIRNYESADPEFHIVIVGRDSAGFTLDGFVIPRLSSGMIGVEEVNKHDR